MKHTDYIPAGYDGIQLVDSVQALVDTKLGVVNCLVYPRKLSGDFNGLAFSLAEIGAKKGGVIRNEKSGFCQFNLKQLQEAEAELPDEQQKVAVRAIIDDLRDVFEASDNYPSLRVVGAKGYEAIGSKGVEDFHADGGEDRLLCCYTAPVTEILRNDQAILNEKTHDYDPVPGAQIFSFQPGDLWKQAGRNILGIEPVIHRAPLPLPGKPPRLLIAG